MTSPGERPAGGRQDGGAWPAVVLAGAGVVVLVAVVGMASHTSALSASPGSGVGHFPTAEAEVVGLVAASALVAALMVTVWAVLAQRGGQRPDLGRPKVLLPSLFLALVAAAVLFGARGHSHGRGRSLLSGLGLPKGPPHRPTNAAMVHFEWAPVVAFAAVLVLAALALLVWKWRRRSARAPGPGTPVPPAAAAGAAIEESLDALRREPDPRLAVIAAYVQMEAGLARAGLPRRPSEAPREMVARVLSDLRVSAGAVEGLTGLFEVARFSPHPVTEGMRSDAIDALVAVRAELAAMVPGGPVLAGSRT